MTTSLELHTQCLLEVTHIAELGPRLWFRVAQHVSMARMERYVSGRPVYVWRRFLFQPRICFALAKYGWLTEGRRKGNQEKRIEEHSKWAFSGCFCVGSTGRVSLYTIFGELCLSSPHAAVFSRPAQGCCKDHCDLSFQLSCRSKEGKLCKQHVESIWGGCGIPQALQL